MHVKCTAWFLAHVGTMKILAITKFTTNPKMSSAEKIIEAIILDHFLAYKTVFLNNLQNSII